MFIPWTEFRLHSREHSGLNSGMVEFCRNSLSTEWQIGRALCQILFHWNLPEWPDSGRNLWGRVKTSQYKTKPGPVWLLDLMSRRQSFNQSSNWIRKLFNMAKSVKEMISWLAVTLLKRVRIAGMRHLFEWVLSSFCVCAFWPLFSSTLYM